MSPVTLDRTLAQGLLVLMHRVYSGEVVHPTQWRLFMTDLERALDAPGTHEDAPGSTQEPEPRQPLTLAGAIALVSNGGPSVARDNLVRLGILCSVCREAPRLPDRDFCGPCQDELNADLAELHDRRQSGHPGSRCNAACGHCGRCG